MLHDGLPGLRIEAAVAAFAPVFRRRHAIGGLEDAREGFDAAEAGLRAISSIGMSVLASQPVARCRRRRRTVAAIVSPRIA
jgi:hypothetical protein